jgi:ribosomal protein S18 acetylase RimI-like enzyme
MKHRFAELEELVVDAWPAAETAELDGWLLRASGGPSHRGNSVATLDFDADDEALLDHVAQVETWYAARGQPALFQIGPCVRPKELDACLKARGYLEQGNAVFALADPEAVLTRAQRGLGARVDAKPDAAWFDAVRRASRFAADLPGFQGFLRRLGTRCRYASVRDPAGNVTACCFGIASEERLGIYAMLTLPEARRQGAARALLHALAASAQAESMRELYLLVDGDNVPARALYQSAGFVDVYAYHYRLQPSLIEA